MGIDYGVNVIPEIDIPAHSLAFTHYKPEIASRRHGMDHLDLYKEETYLFLDSLLGEYISGEHPVLMCIWEPMSTIKEMRNSIGILPIVT